MPEPEEARATKPSAPVLIAGGGIAGLACAISLATRSIAVRILERRPAFAEAGAGIQIGPNGVKALRALGVADLLAPAVGVPDAIKVRDGRSGRILTTLPLGSWIEARHGAPYWTAHRADLHAALLARSRQFSSITIAMGFDVRAVAQEPDAVRVTSATGDSAVGRALLAADGLWSELRPHVAHDSAPRQTKARAYRAVVPAAAAPDGLEAATAAGLWLAPDVHVVHYPVRGGREIAIVVISADGSNATGGERYDDAAVASDVRASTIHLAPALKELLIAAENWGAWSLYELSPPTARWSRERVGLVGDAAHPMLPFLAQGAVMALEDAVELGRLWPATAPADGAVEDALIAFEHARRRRVLRVADTARRNGAIYHMSGPAALARNTVMRLSPGTRLMSRYDWLYGYETAGGDAS